MGTGWRRAFCTRDPETTIDNQNGTQSPTPSPRTCVRLGFLSTNTNPSTPRLQPQQQQQQQPQQTVSFNQSLRCGSITESSTENNSPTIQPKTTSNATSPRSFKLSLFKSSFKFRSSCGICLNSVKTGQGTAIYTAECGHAFHFPCIAAHVSNHCTLTCPVCSATWDNTPLFAQQNDVVVEKANTPLFTQQNDVVAEKNLEIGTKHQQPRHSDSVKSYNDDEPLPSQITYGQIVPIPETDENDEDEDQNDEFPGFSVNPKPPSQKNDGDLKGARVMLMPECAVISVSRSHETYALVLRVKAPPPKFHAPPRSPVDLVAVLDVGGTMSGSKLHMLMRAMRLVISSLGTADRLAIVASYATSKRLLPMRIMMAQGKRVARRVVEKLAGGEGSAVEVALWKAAKVLEDRRDRNPVAGVVLLSDGQDESVHINRNNQRRCFSHVSSTRFGYVDIPVHTFAFGTTETGFSNELDEEEFAKRVGGMFSVVARDLRIRLSVSASAEIRGVYSCSGRPSALSLEPVRLGDLYAEEEKELLVELRVATSALGTPHVMTAQCVYKDPSSHEVVCGMVHALPVLPPPKGAAPPGGRAERLRNVFITSRAIAESRKLAEHDEFSASYHLLASARALLMQFGSALAEECLRGLEAELAEVQWRKLRLEDTAVVRRRRGSEREREREREMSLLDENGEELTPTSAWRAAQKLAKMAIIKKSLNRVSDLHGFENARF